MPPRGTCERTVPTPRPGVRLPNAPDAAAGLPDQLLGLGERPPDDFRHEATRPLRRWRRRRLRRRKDGVEGAEGDRLAGRSARRVLGDQTEVVELEGLEVVDHVAELGVAAGCTVSGRRRRPQLRSPAPLEPGRRLLPARIDRAVQDGKPIAGLGASCDHDWCGPAVVSPRLAFCDTRNGKDTDRRDGLQPLPFPGGWHD